MEEFQEITALHFQQQVLDAQGTVVVKFGADWCPPCQAVDAILSDREFRRKYPNVSFYRVDIDNENNWGIPESIAMKRAANLGNSIPVTVFFRNGKKIGEINGNFDSIRFHDKMLSILASSDSSDI